VGEKFSVMRVSRVIKDPNTGEVLDFKSQKIGEIKVIEISEQIVVAKIVSGDRIKPTDLVINSSAHTTASPNVNSNKKDVVGNTMFGIGNKVSPTNGEKSEVKVSRFPNIDTQDEVLINKEFAVNVSLTQDKITENTQIISTGEKAKVKSVNELDILLPVNDKKKWEIEVVLTGQGFLFKDSKNNETIILPLEGDSTDATFYLTAKPLEKNETERKTRLFATFRHNGAFLAKVEREITIKQNITELPKTLHASQSLGNDAPLAVPPASALGLNAKPAENPTVVGSVTSLKEQKSDKSFIFSIKQKQPDLTIFVQENAYPGQKENSYMQISSPYFKGVREGFFSSDKIPTDWLLKIIGCFPI